MQPKKSLATAESNSVDNEPVHTDPRPGRPSTPLSTRPSHLRRHSPSSLRSESRNRTPVSCLSRESMSGEDCARQRFIVWAAVKRNRSVRMAANERLRCPLLRCGERFDEHEEMLRHLTQCQHLTTGEYVYYECMKVEHFNDKKCTCCLGQPTKRRRIINMAKHFFSNIGSAKVRRENSSPLTYNARSRPPSYDSLILDRSEQHGEAQIGETTQRVERDTNVGPRQPQLELNGTELLELDSTPLRPAAELDAVNYNAHPAARLGRLDSCAEAGEVPASPVPSRISKPRQSPDFPDVLQMNTGALPGGGRRPSLALNTQVDQYRTKPYTAYLSPSSSFQSTSHSISPITPWSASSESSTIWTVASGRDTLLASPITPLSANVHPTAPQENGVSSAEKDIDLLDCPEHPCDYFLGDVAKSHEDSQLSSAIPRLPSGPLMSSYDPKDNYSWLSSMNTELSFSTSVNMMFTDPNTKTAMPPDFLGSQIPGSETKTLVEQVWDALGEHFSNSVSKLSRLQNNPLADNLRGQTPRTVASAGLLRFRRILSQGYSARQDPLEYLCFIHLIYSISLVAHQENLIAISNKLYEQAIAYSVLFDPTYRNSYCQIVTTIWQQNSHEAGEQFRDLTNRPTGNKGKEPDYHSGSMTIANPDPLVVTGQDFLDELENSIVNGSTQQPMEVLGSELWSLHFTSNQPSLQVPTPLTITSGYIVQDLYRRYHDSEDFLRKLKEVGQNARAGYYSTIRKLELELIQTGRKCFTSDDFLSQYIIQVRSLCDQVYAQPENRSRVEYHLLGISLIDSLIRSVSREPQQSQEGHAEYPLVPFSYDDQFLMQDLNKTFGWSYSMIHSTQQPVSGEGVAAFGSTLDLTALQSVTPDAQLATNSPNTLPMRSDASETSRESYTVSPAPLSDVPPDIPVSSSYRSTPPSQARGEGSETSGPSTLASSSQKVEANERCEICGYRPKGDPQWFKGSMAKHKKMQHSTNPPIIYKCPFPGCNSEYKNRRDNLRQHQIEKNHFVGDEAAQRPPKRKRREHA
ncbi:hypothetical protein F4679DRAFT_466421 [Xylaria curta]|nr:hypothetical protein F4679DRAFT_466421 [Xylaria curta]